MLWLNAAAEPLSPINTVTSISSRWLTGSVIILSLVKTRPLGFQVSPFSLPSRHIHHGTGAEVLLLPLEVDAKTTQKKEKVGSVGWTQRATRPGARSLSGGGRGKEEKCARGPWVESSLCDTVQHISSSWKCGVIPRLSMGVPPCFFFHHRGVRWGTGSLLHKYLPWHRLWMEPGVVGAGGTVRTGLPCRLIPHFKSVDW